MSLKKFLLTALFLLLTALMLTHAQESMYYALTGLNLWFLKMIPTLLPFMLLSGLMVRMNLTEYFAGLLSPLLRPLFRIRKNGVYCIIMGFLCGFPMGAKVITELYERKRLSGPEAEYLLSFCNNIGPIYFISFVLPTLGITNEQFPAIPLCIFGMYGLPLLYGLLLRYTRYRDIPADPGPESVLPNVAGGHLLYHLDDAIQAGIAGITSLGGYMILFNLLNLVPHVLCLLSGNQKAVAFLPVINGLLEITSGISRMGNRYPLTVLILLPFGGFSCIAQTYSIIRRTDLPLKTYVLHKLALAGITFVYYVFLGFCGVFSVSPPGQLL